MNKRGHSKKKSPGKAVPGWRRSVCAAGRVWCGIRVVLALLLLTVLYLVRVGFPDSLTRAIQERAARFGVDVRLERVVLHPVHGLLAQQVRVYLRDDDTEPLARFRAISARPNWRFFLHDEWPVRILRAHEGTLEWAPSGRLIDANAGERLRLQSVAAEWHVRPDGWELQYGEARLYDMHVVLTGSGRFHPDAPAAPPRIDDESVSLDRWVERTQPYLEGLRDFLRTLRVQETMQWHVEVRMPSLDMEKIEVQLRGVGRNFVAYGLPFDTVELNAEYRNQTGRLDSFRLTHGDQQLLASGSVHLADATGALRAQSNFSPLYLRNMLPPNVRRYKQQARVNLTGTVDWHWDTGTVRWSDWGNMGGGRVTATQVDAHGVWIEQIEADVRLHERVVAIENIRALIGRGSGQGPLLGNAYYDIPKGSYYGDVRAIVDAHAVLPLAGYSETAAEVIQALVFDQSLPEVDAQFSGRIPPDPAFAFDGMLRGRDFVFSGARVRHFDSGFQVTNRVMRIDPLYVERDEGAVTGWYQQDFNRGWIDLDVQGSVHPRVLGQMGTPHIERILDHFRFEGPVEIDVAGRIDYHTHQHTRYRATGQGERVGWRWLMADTCTLEWIAEGDRIVLTNLHATLYGGELKGVVQLDGLQKSEAHPIRYTASGELQGIRFSHLLRDLRQVDDETREGLLSGGFQVEGLAEDDWRASITGAGWVRIRDGEVFEIRLLGGLSQLLGRIYPRLGSAVQTDVRGHFELRQRQVLIDEMRMEGNLLSLKGWGRYHLDDRLDFRVQVQPLRRGMVVDAVRIVTYPLSRLLQFQLDGTLDAPRWRIDSIPLNPWSVLERSVDHGQDPL